MSRIVSIIAPTHVILTILFFHISLNSYVFAQEQNSLLGALVSDLTTETAYQYEKPKANPLPSLQSFTGLWDMPTARVLPDWHVRLKYGKSEPQRYYGVALGLFDRIEIHGQFTENSSLIAFPGSNYGYYKDRNAGVRVVLLKEGFLPQVAVGAYDPIGTSLFPSRYLVASKMMNRFDVTLGIGQGLLGGEPLSALQAERKAAGPSETEGFDTTFLFSDPFRQTKVFGGVEYHHTPKLTLSAEYSSLKYEGLHGGPDKAKWPINFGVKYRLNKYCLFQGAYTRGEEWSYGFSADLPLNPEGLLTWKKEAPYSSSEKLRWQTHEADNRKLAELIANELKNDGFGGVQTSVNDREIWIEFVNNKYLSHPKAFGRVATIVDTLAPARIEIFYLNLASKGQVLQSLRTTRLNLRAFMKSSMDKEAFLQFANFSFYDQANRDHFVGGGETGMGSKFVRAKYDWYSYGLDLKVKTFLNNKAGFFKHKIFLRPFVTLYPWKNGRIISEFEFTLLNEFDEVLFAPKEPEPARTDIVLYEQESHPRISMLAFEQHLSLPHNVLGRFSTGLFESSFAGVGGELFRFFKEGRFGVGAEVELVRKRDPESNFELSNTITKTYKTYYLNLYSHVVPSLGIEAGVKIGRFLADDFGAKFELRRTFKHFTLGAWYTHTDTDHMISADNRGNNEKGVFIRIPLSLFKDHDERGRLTYTFSSFTKDPGQSVRQPSHLYPMDPYHSLSQTKSHLEDMRNQ